MKKIFFLFIMSLPLLLIAQRQKVGNLTVFSEDGDKFYLILNGEKQNDVAQTNLRIEELPQPYYNAKIIFVDSTITAISKNNLLIADPDGVMMDVTYKIKKDKSHKAKLNYYSSIAVQQDYIPPAGVYVHHYGKPDLVEANSVTVKTTTTDAFGASVNMNGVSMNVSISDPNMNSTTTSSTTTSSSSTNSNSSNSKCNGWAMKQDNFSAALKTISNSNFEESKLSAAKTISSSNCLSSDQVVKICNLFNFEESKLAFAKHAYKRTTDPKNYFKVTNVFSFDNSKEDLNKFISEEQD